MIVDCLVEANQYFKFHEHINDPEVYCTYTDSLLGYIQRSTDPSLKASKDILTRIKNRDIYRFVDQILVNENLSLIIKEVNIYLITLLVHTIEYCLFLRYFWNKS